MWLIKASLRNPYMVLAFAMATALLGALALLRIPVDILPAFKSPAVQVLTYYPGMPAAAIERTITNRLERWVNQAPGARLVESRSVPGVSVVRVFFREDTDPNQALTLVNSLALGALPNLPPNTLPPVALPFDATGTLPVGILTVSNPLLDDAKQKDTARIDVRNMLGSVPGCIAPVVVGGQDRTVMVYLDPAALAARNLVPTDVVGALRRGNLMAAPGTAYIGGRQLLLDSNSMLGEVADFNQIPITLGPGRNVFLGDIGRAEDASAIQTSRVLVDGTPEVFVPIYRQQGSSSLDVVRELRRLIPWMESRLPEGTSLRLAMDQTVAVAKALGALAAEGALGAALVSLMLLLFLGEWRMAAIAILSIPLSLLGAIGALYATGNTLNLMTLAGLALAIGPLVDDAIVELENHHRHHAMGKTRLQAALDGCGEVVIPVLVACCTTALVLAPLAFLPGTGGFLFQPLAVAVGFAMLFSFLLSRTFVPMMCAKFLPERPPARPTALAAISRPVRTGMEKLRTAYLSALSACLRRPLPLLAGLAILCAATAAAFPHIGREFFPKVDSGQLTVRLRAPSDFRLSATEERVRAVEAFLRANIPARDRTMVVSEIGLNPDWSAAYTTNAGQQDAAIRVQLAPDRERSSLDYAASLREKFRADPAFADLSAEFDTGGMVSTALNLGATSPIDIELDGGSTAQLLEAARTARDAVAAVPGTADVRILQRNDAPYLVLEVDRTKAAQLGLSAEDVILQAVVALNSSVPVHRNFWVDSQSGNQYFIGVQYPEDAGRRLEDILSIPVAGTAGASPPPTLGTLVSAVHREGEVEINHSGLRRVANVLANTSGRDLGSVAEDVNAALGALTFPKGVSWRMKGEYGRMGETFRSLGAGMLLSIALVYLLQVVLFRSWTGPAVIMVSVPLGLVGVVWMLFLTGTGLNIQSIVGATFLAGIAVNNGVLLVEFANRLRAGGAPDAAAAIHAAAAARFQPILMTSLATALAMLPLAIGAGHGSEATTPLARAVIGGMLASAPLTLFALPVLYTIFLRKPPRAPEPIP